MLLSISLLLGLGIIGQYVSQKLKLPALISYLLIGLCVGPFALNGVAESFLNVGPDIKKIALIIILIRAGLSLNIEDLERHGKVAILMCILPATVEIGATIILGHLLLGLTYLEALILGTVIAAVSPAVVVPGMINMMDRGNGTKEGIPQLILAGASADDIYVLVLFTVFMGMQETGDISFVSFLAVPVSIILGIIVGWLLSKGIGQVIHRTQLKTVSVVVLLLAMSMLLLVVEEHAQGWFSGLIAVIVLAMGIADYLPDQYQQYKHQFNQLWVVAEMFLFMFVGMATNLQVALSFGWVPILFIILTSGFRMLGVYLALQPTQLTSPEKLFTMGAYLPKATVQAAIGGIPLAMGMDAGALILTVAVLEILITAPIGAVWIAKMQDKLLS